MANQRVGFGQASDTLRVMQYNLTNYGNNAFGCTTATNGVAKKDSLMRIIFDFAKPDLIGVNEVFTNPTYSQRILQLDLNINGVTTWAKATSNWTNGSDLMNAFFYNTTKVGLKAQYKINTIIRLVDHYRMYVQPQPGQTDTTFFNVIVAHLKAGNTAADRSDRESQAATLSQYLTPLNIDGEAFIFQGDLNVYSSTEVNYQMLVNPAQGGYLRDPLNRQGNWDNNAAFADVHTQCPSTATGGCFVGGGLDDRFDQQLATTSTLSGDLKIKYLPAAFRVLGNDGKHFNGNITDGTNSSAPPAVLGALIGNSDHLPILGKLLVSYPVATKPSFVQNRTVWLQSGQLHLNGLASASDVRVYTLTGSSVEHFTSSSAAVTQPLPPVGGSQWLLVHVFPLQSGFAPSFHRVWYEAQ
jgi:hypothetical protein